MLTDLLLGREYDNGVMPEPVRQEFFKYTTLTSIRLHDHNIRFFRTTAAELGEGPIHCLAKMLSNDSNRFGQGPGLTSAPAGVYLEWNPPDQRPRRIRQIPELMGVEMKTEVKDALAAGRVNIRYP
jgi:hypothetical protein